MIRANKRALRKAIGTTLREVSETDIQSQSQAIAAKVLALPAFQSCRAISCYLSMPASEAQTTSLIMSILADQKKQLFVPTIVSEEDRMDFVRLHDEEDFQGLPIGLWGIPQPTAQWKNENRQSISDVCAENLDVILLPGLAFDKSLSRLGHGKGYYDRFLSTYIIAAKRPRPLLVALALQQQLLDAGQVPITDSDWKVDMIITPNDTVTKPNDF